MQVLMARQLTLDQGCVQESAFQTSILLVKPVLCGHTLGICPQF